MLTSIRGLSAATLSAGLLLSAAPAFASEASSDVVVDPYPRAGVSFAAWRLNNQAAALSFLFGGHNGTWGEMCRRLW